MIAKAASLQVTNGIGSCVGGTASTGGWSNSDVEVFLRCFRHCSEISKFVNNSLPELFVTFLKKMIYSVAVANRCSGHYYSCWVFVQVICANCFRLTGNVFDSTACYALWTLVLLLFTNTWTSFFRNPYGVFLPPGLFVNPIPSRFCLSWNFGCLVVRLLLQVFPWHSSNVTSRSWGCHKSLGCLCASLDYRHLFVSLAVTLLMPLTFKRIRNLSSRGMRWVRQLSPWIILQSRIFLSSLRQRTQKFTHDLVLPPAKVTRC